MSDQEDSSTTTNNTSNLSTITANIATNSANNQGLMDGYQLVNMAISAYMVNLMSN